MQSTTTIKAIIVCVTKLPAMPIFKYSNTNWIQIFRISLMYNAIIKAKPALNAVTRVFLYSFLTFFTLENNFSSIVVLSKIFSLNFSLAAFIMRIRDQTVFINIECHF